MHAQRQAHAAGARLPRRSAGSAYHHGRLREALVRAAGEILQERGLEKLTLRECARRVGVSHSAPAHHFKDVAGLISEVAASGFDALRSLMERKQQSAGADPLLRLRAAGVAYIEFAVTHRALFQLMFRSDRIATSSERLRIAADATLGVLMRSIGAAHKLPSRKQYADMNAARVLLAWSIVHGFAMLLLEGQLARFQGKRGARRFSRDMGEKILSLVRESFAQRP